MNRHDIHLLQKIKGSPAVTITLPTHRTAPDNRQDPIRVKNLVKQAAAGEYQIFDPVSSELVKRSKLPVLLMSGKDLAQVSRVIKNPAADIGTKITS